MHNSFLHKRLHKFIWAVSVTTFSLNVFAAQISELDFEELFNVKVVELASGIEQKINRAPAVASVITADDIQAAGALTLHEALEMVPGIHIVPASLADMYPVISLRGMFTNRNPHILILIDGKRISSFNSNGLAPNLYLSTFNIEQIEVIRGPGSALYGTDAFAGVINMVTKKPENQNKTNVSVSVGSFNHQRITARTNLNFADTWLGEFYAEHIERNEDTSRIVDADLQTLLDSLFGTHASLAPGYLDDSINNTSIGAQISNERWSIAARYWKNDAPLFLGVANALDHEGERKQKELSATIEYSSDTLFESWRFTPSIHYEMVEDLPLWHLFPDGTTLPVGSDGNISLTQPIAMISFPDGIIGRPTSKITFTEIELPLLQMNIKEHQIRYSLGYQHTKYEHEESKNFGPGVLDITQSIVNSALTNVTGTQYIFLPNEIRHNINASIQDIWNITDNIELTLGVRYDNYSQLGSAITPRASLVWEINKRWTTKLLYGNAFRTPSHLELRVSNNPVGKGNPDLNSETLDSYELSLSYLASKTVWGNLNLYQYKAIDLIDYVRDSAGGKSTTQNVNTLNGKGLEMELFWHPTEQLKFNFNYALQSTDNSLAGQQQPFVPKQQVYLEARWLPNEHWMLSLNTKGILDRERELGDNRSPVQDYWLSNASVRYTRSNWYIAAYIKNLFNEDIREPAGISTGVTYDFPMNQRHGMIELGYSF